MGNTLKSGLVAVLFLVLVACGTSAPAPTATPTSLPTPTRTLAPKVTDTSTPSSSRESDITNFIFENLTISVGTTVTWTNQDRDTHTSTSGEASKADGVWDSKLLEQGEQFSTTFSQPGVFPYWCRIHPLMRATVTVEVQQ